MTIAGFIGGFESIIIILVYGAIITLIVLAIKKFKQWDEAIKEVSANQKLILEKLEEYKK